MKHTGPRPFDLNRSLWPAVGILLAAFLVFEFTPIDLWLQDHCFDFANRQWWVDGKATVPRLVFYDGPKVALIVFGVGVLLLGLGPRRLRSAWGLAQKRRSIWAILATLATGPILVGLGKATTNIFCPFEITRYGGDVPYVRVMECYPEDSKPLRRGRCFPAGHASGGFALMALAGLGRSRRAQLMGIAVGLTAGLWMGVYQVLNGSHYLSHTVVTALVMWIIFLIWGKGLRVDDASDDPVKGAKAL